MSRSLPLTLLGVALVCASAEAEPQKTTFSLKREGCPGCPATLQRELSNATGVLSAKVDWKHRSANVTYERDKTDAGAIAAAMIHKGFAVRLAPWEPVDAGFTDCANGCGLRQTDARVHAQPGASEGDDVRCPVSGVVFRVTAASMSADVGGKPVYLCCEGCARHLEANRERVLALRGIAQ